MEGLTVSQLIEALRRFDGSAEVVLPSYNHGWDDREREAVYGAVVDEGGKILILDAAQAERVGIRVLRR